MKILQNKFDNLASNNKISNHKFIINSDNEDNLTSQPQSFWQPTFIATNRFIPVFKFQTFFSTIETTIKVRKNKKYPNIPLFYGNAEDREKWEEWRLYFELKFHQSAILYTYEQNKIDYIRNHCKNTAFEVIKAKANLTFANIYLTRSKMI